MATKTPKTTTPAVETTATAPVTDELASLRAEQKALAARVKELRASQPKVNKLEAEIARQATDGTAWIKRTKNRVSRRVRAGQPLDEAVDAVLAHLRALLLPPTA